MSLLQPEATRELHGNSAKLTDINAITSVLSRQRKTATQISRWRHGSKYDNGDAIHIGAIML